MTPAQITAEIQRLRQSRRDIEFSIRALLRFRKSLTASAKMRALHAKGVHKKATATFLRNMKLFPEREADRRRRISAAQKILPPMTKEQFKDYKRMRSKQVSREDALRCIFPISAVAPSHPHAAAPLCPTERDLRIAPNGPEVETTLVRHG